MPVIDRFLRDRPEIIIERLNDFLSVDEPTILAVQCYPNPFTEEIRIGIESESFGAKEIAIYDLMGRKVFVQPCCLSISQKEIVLHPDLKDGVYILKIGDYSQRIVRY